jgi:hypothetical protein
MMKKRPISSGSVKNAIDKGRKNKENNAKTST